jgi:hypothetical protein
MDIWRRSGDRLICKERDKGGRLTAGFKLVILHAVLFIDRLLSTPPQDSSDNDGQVANLRCAELDTKSPLIFLFSPYMFS